MGRGDQGRVRRLPVPASALERTFGALRVRAGERRRVALMMVYSVAAMGGVHTVGKSVASALFLSRLSPSAIPFLFVLPGVTTAVALLVYSAVASRVGLNHIVVGSVIVLAACLLVFRLVLSTSLGSDFAVLAALFVVVDLAATLVFLQFWTYAGEAFDVLEARRLFGLIAIGGTISNIIAGLTLRQFAGLVGTDNLLFIVVLSLVACGLCGWALGRWHGETKRLDARRQEEPSLAETMVGVVRFPLLRSIGIITVLVAVLVAIGTYEFFVAVDARYAGRESAMVAFLGGFQIWAGLAALVVQLDLTGRIMSRFGAIGALLAFPLGMTGAAIASLATKGSLGAITAVRANDPVFRHTINQAGLNVLYLPTPGRLGRRAKEVHAVWYAVALAIMGLVFLGVRSTGWGYAEWAYVTFGVTAVWCAVLVKTRHRYVSALSRSVSRRELDVDAQPVDLDDETTASVLVAGLHDPDHVRVVHSLQLVAQAPSGRWHDELVRLLGHSSPEVRAQAVAVLAVSGSAEDVADVEKLLADPEAGVRLAALDAAIALGADPVAAQALLDDPEPSVRAQAAAALLALAPPETAGQRLRELLASPEIEVRCAAIDALPAAPASAELLGPFFSDSEPHVRRRATAAAGRLAAPELVPRLLDALGDPQVTAAAADSLVALGSAGVPTLAAALSDGDDAVRAAIPRVLERLGTPEAMRLLDAHVSDPDERVAIASLRGLANARRRDPTFPLIVDRMRDELAKAVRSCYAIAALRADLGADAREPLLADALHTRTGRALDRVFLLLACLHPEQKVEWARHAIDSPDKHARALAVELVVTLAERRVEDLLLALADAPEKRVVELAETRFAIERRPAAAQLLELARSENAWLAACAVRRIGQRGSQDLAAAIDEALGRPEPVLREAAVSARAQLAGALA